MKTGICVVTPPPKQTNERAHLFAAAGLLHDIGKVFEPADVPLGEAEQRLEQMICPTRNGRATHKHVLYTAYALNHLSSNFGGLPADRLFAIACNHHRPSAGNVDEHILTRADWLASGHDRRKNEDSISSTVTGLISILATVGAGAPNHREKAQLPTVGRSFKDCDFLPGDAQNWNAYADACKIIGERFLKSVNRHWDTPRAAVDGLLAASRALLATVPSSRSRDETPDVSLFDHSLAVAAFSACLGAIYDTGNPDGTHEVHASKIEGRYRLVTLNIGGIQRFIFRVMPPVDDTDSGEKGRAKRLRARSWLVSMLTHLAARRILESTGMPSTNCVFEAGGRAILLMPCCDEVDSLLHDAIDYCRCWMHDNFAGTLRLDIGVSDALSNKDFSQEQFGDTYRMASSLPDRARIVDGASPWKTEDGWREDAWVGSTPGLPIDTEEWRRNLNELGRALTKARVAYIDASETKDSPWKCGLFGYTVSLYENEHSQAKSSPIWLDLPEDPSAQTLLNAGYVPRDDTGPKTFDEIATLAVDEDGTPARTVMLGVLKADVDDLGYLISSGFQERVSLGRLAAFSRSLDDLFKGFMPAQLKHAFPNMYTVFSGGDDLLFIGPWLDTIRLASEVERWLRAASARNQEITLSAGIALAKPGAPIRTLAGAAADSLETAKSGDKNAVCLGNTRMKWDDLRAAIERHRLLFDLAEKEIIGASMIYRMLCYAKNAMAIQQGTPIPLAGLKWRAQMRYDLHRNLPSEKQEEVNELRQWLISIRGENACVLYIACTLALYRLRGE